MFCFRSSSSGAFVPFVESLCRQMCIHMHTYARTLDYGCSYLRALLFIKQTRAAAAAETQARLARNADSEAERLRLAELVETLQQAAKTHAQERAAALEAVQQARAEKEETRAEQEEKQRELEIELAATSDELSREKEARAKAAQEAAAETEKLVASAREGAKQATAELVKLLKSCIPSCVSMAVTKH